MSNDKPASILIFRGDHLGDLVLYSGALRHLRRHWPHAKITLCVKPFGLELFAHCPYLDELISCEKLYAAVNGYIPGLPRFRGRDRLGAFIRRCAPDWTVRRFRCDMAILPLLSATESSHNVMRQIPAKTRIGICGKTTLQTAECDLAARRWYTRQWDVSALPWNFSELEANRLFLEFLGVDMQGQDFSPEFWTTTEDKYKATKLISPAPGQITLAIAPGVSSSPGKKLPAAWFVEAVQKLACTNLRVVLLGSPRDAPDCAEVAQALARQAHEMKAVDLTGKTTVCEMIECLRRCDLVLSQDSAALHMATALQKPVVGIMAGAHFGRFYPWGDPTRARVVNKPMECYGCEWRCIYDSYRCLQEIPPADATRELQGLIDTFRMPTSPAP